MTMLPGMGPQKKAAFFDPAQEIEAKRIREMAKQLSDDYRGTAKNEMGGGKNGGYVVARSPLENINQQFQLSRANQLSEQAGGMEGDASAQRQKLYAEALSSTDPREAAAILAQDPSSIDTATKLYGDALSAERADANWLRDANLQREIMGMKNEREDMNWERDAELKRELQRMRSQGDGNGTYIDPDTGEVVQGYSNKPLPVGALKLQNEAVEAIGAASGTADLSKSLMGQIDSGELELSPVSNFINSARNWAGASNDKSVNFANMKTGLEKLRNDTLRLNKGVQTEGDAVRAMNEVLQSVNDPKVFKAAMEKLNAVNDRASELQKLQVNNIRGNYNAAPMNFDAMGQLPSAVPQSNPADKIRSYLAGKGMNPQQIDAYLQSKGL